MRVKARKGYEGRNEILKIIEWSKELAHLKIWMIGDESKKLKEKP